MNVIEKVKLCSCQCTAKVNIKMGQKVSRVGDKM